MVEVRWRRKALDDLDRLDQWRETVKTQDVAVVEHLGRLAALFFPLLYRSQGILFDEPAQVE
jgi:hypothetical protein